MSYTTTATDTKTVPKTPKFVAPIPPVICYRLSDKYFLDCGWTVKPNKTKGVPFLLMRARFSHKVISPWFRERPTNLRVKYQNGESLYFAKTDGSGKIYYPNGRLAVKIEKGGIDPNRTKVWVHSPGTVDEDGFRYPPRLCALFDSFGCGVVYDHCMNKRLVYNQVEGVWYDTPHPVRWKWHNLQYSGTLPATNDQVEDNFSEPVNYFIGASPSKESERFSENRIESSIESSATYLSQKITREESEFREMSDVFKYINTDKIMPRDVSPLKPIVMQLNAFIALKIWNQSEISLNFYASGHHTKLNIGILYNPYEVFRVTEVNKSFFEKGKIICPFEQFPARTKSMVKFQETVKKLRVANGSSPPGTTELI